MQSLVEVKPIIMDNFMLNKANEKESIKNLLFCSETSFLNPNDFYIP